MTDEIGVRALAKKCFQIKSFYKDPKISNKIACKIKEEWARNFFLGKRGNWMVIAEKNSKINRISPAYLKKTVKLL